ncbi:SDR family oxidoreductase [Brevundimonas goettingensis]|uniref:SDR family NAD(P)-dependent oxidoreductase n=1 Tax=Brevundimonas goettingensis TaxID=2774190 RepID=A0A975GUK7_9CAUL|nr:SDR family oxidoreductase [Brevundimonas goettingensis]QTC90266.1 SDR family NAD(P)-dependent oxidoreductase [Brevundimonas goettingensis]
MPRSLKPLSQQTIVITGASSGIGLEIARRAARAGAKVFLISRNADGLASICDSLRGAGYAADFAAADVGDEAALRAAANQCVARYGRIDSWINSAGVAIYVPLLETPPMEHERLFRTNYWGVVNAARLAVPLLRQGGAFVTVGSVASDLGAPVLGAYAASKHAVKGYIDSLRIELLAAGDPVSVTLIKPSGVGTPLAEHAANHLGVAARVPPPAYGPGVVARAVLHAVQRPRREITVGGVGFLQILAAAHSPGLADRISSLVPALLRDRKRRPSLTNNLGAPGPGGETLSRFEPSRPFSLFTGASLHPGMVFAVAGAILASALALRKTMASQ